MWFLMVVVSVATTLGFLGEVWWVFDLFAHFRLHYVVVLLAVVVVAALRRRGWLATAALPALAVNAALVLPLWTGGVSPDPERAVAGRLRVVQYNVLTSNRQTTPLLAWVVRQNADLIVLQEVNSAWITAARVALPGYAMLDNAAPQRNNFGMVMFARADLVVDDAAIAWDGVGVPRLEATVRVGGADGEGGTAVRVFGVHTLPPVGAHYAGTRDAQLRELEDRVNDAGAHVVVIGDLNATPWSAPYRRLMQNTPLRSVAAGRGPRGTWPAGAGSWLGIPLDHVLFGPGLAALDHRLAPASSSDHRGVVADLAVYAEAAGAEAGAGPDD